MASSQEDAIRRRISKKIFRKSREGHRPTLAFPDRFKDLRDDTEEDVLPPSQGPQMFMNMNQSIFGLIAAAGSNVDFNDRFEGQSSDEEDGAHEDSNKDDGDADIPGKGKLHERVTKTTVLKPGSSSKESDDTNEGEKQERRASGHLLRSLPQLPRLARSSLSNRTRLRGLRPFNTSGGNEIEMPTADSPPPAAESDLADRGDRPEPVMSRMLEARAEMSSRPSFDLEGSSRDQQNRGAETGPSTLAQKLKEIFEFEELEEVIEGMVQLHYALFMANDHNRVSLLATPKCPSSRFFVHYLETRLLLCISAQKICKLGYAIPAIGQHR
jgi:sterol 3beta-glucosyltransferase